MKICVFGASSTLIDDGYKKAVEELGEKISARGHSLVFGSGATGLMGAVARGVKKGGGDILGVVPSFFKEHNIEPLFEGCDKVIYTNTMRERKAVMDEAAEAFIIAPGGVGTYDEFFEILTLKQLNDHDKAIVILNLFGYYDNLLAFLKEASDKKFITKTCLTLFEVVNTADEALNYLESYVPVRIPYTGADSGD